MCVFQRGWNEFFFYNGLLLPSAKGFSFDNPPFTLREHFALMHLIQLLKGRSSVMLCPHKLTRTINFQQYILPFCEVVQTDNIRFVSHDKTLKEPLVLLYFLTGDYIDTLQHYNQTKHRNKSEGGCHIPLTMQESHITVQIKNEIIEDLIEKKIDPEIICKIV